MNTTTTETRIAWPPPGPATPARYARLDHVFNLVKNTTHWKDRIDARIDASLATEDEIYEAVVHYTGSVPSIRPLKDGRLWVRAAGYWRAIGA